MNTTDVYRQAIKRTFSQLYSVPPSTVDTLRSLVCRVYPHSLDRAVKLLTFLVGQCHDDRIFINAKQLGRVVVGIAED